MTTPISRFAYQVEYDILDQALESERGVQRIFKGHIEGRGQAMNFRVRLHEARSQDRRNNRKIYPPDDPMHGETVYSQVTVRAPYWDADRQGWVLKIERNQIGDMLVEEIPSKESA